MPKGGWHELPHDRFGGKAFDTLAKKLFSSCPCGRKECFSRCTRMGNGTVITHVSVRLKVLLAGKWSGSFQTHFLGFGVDIEDKRSKIIVTHPLRVAGIDLAKRGRKDRPQDRCRVCMHGRLDLACSMVRRKECQREDGMNFHMIGLVARLSIHLQRIPIDFDSCFQYVQIIYHKL